MMNLTSRRSRAVIALAAALTLAGSVAEARMGRGGSFGSRGARTWSAPPATRTAPTDAAPIQRSQVPQNQFQQRPGTPSAAQAAQPRRFGFGGGLMAGLLGAGLFGLLLGNGFLGGLAGFASFLGLLLQIGLIVLLVSFAVKWFRRRQEPSYAGPTAHHRSTGGSVPPTGGGLGGMMGGAMGGGPLGGGPLGGGPLGGGLGTGLHRGRAQDAPRRPGVTDEIGIGEPDYADFERTLHEIQAVYSKGDVAGLWELATPEMAGYVQEEINENARNGVVNEISDVRLLQGDLSEAWREGSTDYATVAMRFAMIDVIKNKTTGQVVEGDPTRPVEVTELWTFRRDQGSSWKLAAIQQA